MKLRINIWFLAILLLFSGCRRETEYRAVDGVMLGTTLHLLAQTQIPTEEIFTIAMDIDREMKRSMSVFDKESLLSRLNRSETDSVDCHIAYNLRLSREISLLGGGAYDVTVGPLVKAWGFAGKAADFSPNLDSLLQFVGVDKVALQEREGRLILWKADPRVELDFNSIAKGYTVDLLARELRNRGIENFLVDIGGEVRCQGVNRQGLPWRIGVERPVDGAPLGESYEMRIALQKGALATSGNYRRYFIDPAGRKVAHTINPRTGESVVSALLSATVVAEECARADAMATMLMALGADGALDLVAQHPEWPVLLILASDEEGVFRTHLTPAMENLILN